jgi:hypothetical protein
VDGRKRLARSPDFVKGECSPEPFPKRALRTSAVGAQGSVTERSEIDPYGWLEDTDDEYLLSPSSA